jgi:transcriptional regulator with XRE-family HTH domain
MEVTGKKYSATVLLTADGPELTKARINKNLRLEDVAQRLGDGVNRSSVSRWEQGKIQPSMERLFALVKILGTYDFVRLNGKAILTQKEIEAVRKLRNQ